MTASYDVPVSVAVIFINGYGDGVNDNPPKPEEPEVLVSPVAIELAPVGVKYVPAFVEHTV